MLHDLTKNGIDIATQRHFKIKGKLDDKLRGVFIHRLEGYINFTGQVRGKRDALYLRFKDSFDGIFSLPEAIKSQHDS